MHHVPFNPSAHIGYVECPDLQTQDAFVSFAKWHGNYSVRPCMLNSLVMTSSNSPCVVNVSKSDLDAFLAKGKS